MKITIQKLTGEELESMGVFKWPIWSCEISEFPWSYPVQETCYLLEGQVEVTTDLETVTFSMGDFVVFPAGLSCTWKVLQAVKKHYSMG